MREIASRGGRSRGFGFHDGAAQLLRETHLFGNVGGVFDDVQRFAGGIENGVVARLQPDLAPALGEALVLSRVVHAASEFGPERPILGTLTLLRTDEQAVVSSLDLRERIPHGAGEVVVGFADGAVELELDDGQGTIDGGELALAIGAPEHGGRDVARVFDHLQQAATAAEYRVVGCLQPDLAAALGEALVFAGVELTSPELRPELPVFGAVAKPRLDEQAVVSAPDLGQRVADGLEEIVVGGTNRSVQVEFGDGLRAVDGRQLTLQVGDTTAAHEAKTQAQGPERIEGHSTVTLVLFEMHCRP